MQMRIALTMRVVSYLGYDSRSCECCVDQVEVACTLCARFFDNFACSGHVYATKAQSTSLKLPKMSLTNRSALAGHLRQRKHS